MAKKSFYLHTDDADLINYLSKQKNISEFLREIVIRYKNGLLIDAVDAQTAKELNAIYKQLQIKNLELRSENLGYKNRIDAVRATAAETFNGKISPQAENAIKTRFEDAKPTTQKQLSINAVLRFMESCKLNDMNQWVVICEKCRADFIDTNREKALSDFRDHMTTQHAKELLT